MGEKCRSRLSINRSFVDATEHWEQNADTDGTPEKNPLYLLSRRYFYLRVTHLYRQTHYPIQ
jgi:hypothetical protein